MFGKVRVALGQGFLDRYTILELKWLCSVYFHVFNTVEQDRFHTHAFNGLAIVLRGGYWEEFLDESGQRCQKWVGPGIRYIPRAYNHRLLRSKSNTLSILFAGPWSRTWTEENDQFVRTLTWGRKELHRKPKHG